MSDTKKTLHKKHDHMHTKLDLDTQNESKVGSTGDVVHKKPSPIVKENDKKDSGLLWTSVLVALTGAALVGAMTWALASYGKKMDEQNKTIASQNTEIKNLTSKVDALSSKVTAGAAPAPAKKEIKYGKTNVGEAAIKGDKNTAKVAIVEYSDYECPFCKRHVTQTMPSIVKDYVDNGKAIYVYRNNPLPFHEPNATQQAMAAECAGEQGKFWEMHDQIFTVTNSNKQNLNEELLKTLPSKIPGLNVSQWNSCYSSNKYADRIKKDMAAAEEAGLSGTPGFVVGKFDKNTGVVDGVLISGAYPYSAPSDSTLEIDFKRAIDKYLN